MSEDTTENNTNEPAEAPFIPVGEPADDSAIDPGQVPVAEVLDANSGAGSDAVPVAAAAKPQVNRRPTREQLRNAILGAKPEIAEVEFGGFLVNMIQPSLDELLQMQEDAKTDNKGAIVRMIIAYASVPETGEKIFDDTDVDGLLSSPFSPDMSNLISSFQKLTGVTVTEADKS